MAEGPNEALRKEMFAWHGSTMYAAQLLEHELVTLHIGLRRLQDPAATLDDLDSLDTLMSRRTLGALVHALQKQPEPAPQLAATLGPYVEIRNDLAHHFFKRHGSSFLTRLGVEAMIAELQAAYEQLREADALATKVSAAVREKLGWSEEQFQALAAAEVSRLMADANQK